LNNFDDETLRRYSVFLSVGMLARLKAASKATGLSMVMIIRQAVTKFLDEKGL
jgi:predicted DNA-binding protein